MNMRFIRKARFRERALDFISKALLIGISVLACLWMVSGAHAASPGGPASITGIKAGQREDGSYSVDFSLSRKPKPEDVQVEFERNFIQVSFKGASAYPARTESVNQGILEKVFTYQYQPDLARARVLLKAAASTVKAGSSWEPTPAGLRLTVRSAAVEAGSPASDMARAEAPALGDAEEERVVREILGEAGQGPGSPARPEAPPAVPRGEDTPLFAAKGPSAEGPVKESAGARIAASLLLVVGLIGACAVGVRRFALGRGVSLRRAPKVIELVASQSLGPKRSIALVKVLDQYMVVGMAGDGMSLLANLGADAGIEKLLDAAGGPGTSFSDAFAGALTAPAARTDTAGPPLGPKAVAGLDLGIRGAIKKRIEGFKPL